MSTGSRPRENSFGKQPFLSLANSPLQSWVQLAAWTNLKDIVMHRASPAINSVYDLAHLMNSDVLERNTMI